MTQIHPTALIDKHAQLDSSVVVGPYAVIGPHVSVAAGSTIGSHTVIEGYTSIGENNQIFQFASIGAQPQDKKYRGEPTRLVIGNGNTIREFCTLNTGTIQDKGLTQIGDDNWIMAYVHIAHDCFVGDHTIIANSVQLAGHVSIEDWAIIGGLSGIHQFVRVGAHSMVGFSSRVNQDLPPFMTAAGNPIGITGVNQEGLKRRGFDPSRIARIKTMHRMLYRNGWTLAQAVEAIEGLQTQMDASDTEARADVTRMQTFLSQADRGIVR